MQSRQNWRSGNLSVPRKRTTSELAAGVPRRRSALGPGTRDVVCRSDVLHNHFATVIPARSSGRGAIFRPVDRHSRVHEGRLSGEGVALVIRERTAAAGLDPAPYSGHSLRAGLVTSATQQRLGKSQDLADIAKSTRLMIRMGIVRSSNLAEIAVPTEAVLETARPRHTVLD